MKPAAVRVVPWRDKSRFDVRHWGKHITTRSTQAEAETVATELRQKLDRARFQREEKSRARKQADGHRGYLPPCKPEDIDTWRQEGRDPTQPEYHWCNVYPADGSAMRREYHRIPPGGNSHWTRKYRTGWSVCDGLMSHEGLPPDYRGTRSVLPSLPQLPFADSIKCRPPHSLSSDTDSSAESKPAGAIDQITEPSGPGALPPPPAEVSAAPIPTSSSPFSNELTDQGRTKVKPELWDAL